MASVQASDRLVTNICESMPPVHLQNLLARSHLKSTTMADNPTGTDRTGNQATQVEMVGTHFEGHKLTLILPPLSGTHRVPEEEAAQPTPGDGQF
jgi:hypothetical protein